MAGHVSTREQSKAAAIMLQDGFNLHQPGDLKGAERCYRKILKKDKKHVEALCLLGSLLSQTGDHASAEATLGAALSEQPGHVPAP